MALFFAAIGSYSNFLLKFLFSSPVQVFFHVQSHQFVNNAVV